MGEFHQVPMITLKDINELVRQKFMQEYKYTHTYN